jgi:hypothetical protein
VKELFPERWADAWFFLAAPYFKGVQGMSMADAEEKAIGCYTQYLDMSNEESTYWTDSHGNMAVLFDRRTRGDRVANKQKSMKHYAASKAGSSVDETMRGLMEFGALSFFDEFNRAGGFNGKTSTSAALLGIDNAGVTAHVDMMMSLFEKSQLKETDSMAWATDQMKLADQCLKLFDQEERRANVEKAIGYCESALKVLTKEAFPDEWADLQMKMCGAYMQRVDGGRRENMEKAMRCFNSRKEVRPDETLPADFLKKQWARGADARKNAAATSKE